MRKYIAILLVLMSVILGFESCTSYENGPAFSFLTPKKRVVGEWHFADLLINDKREQPLFDKEASSVLLLKDDNTYTYTMRIVRSSKEFTGQWAFGEDKTELVLSEIDSVSGNIEHNYRITRLTSKEMWLVSKDNEYSGIDDLIERHFEKKED